MKITLGFSPCPNDTFIFDALVHQKIDTEGIDFQIVMEDVEELNRRAFAKELDVTKLSYHALGWMLESYALLDSGSALGRNCGPLLIAKKILSEEEINFDAIAIPGKYTTANFLLGLAYPLAANKQEMLFSKIEEAVLSGEVKSGLIIHENRFTYQEKGLVKIRDLGEFWEETTGMPITLGGIVVKRSLSKEIQEKINRLVRASVEFAMQNPLSTKGFVIAHAQEMSEEVMYKHINLYVNDYTKDLGDIGRRAVNKLLSTGMEKKIIPTYTEKNFIH